jgi:hypothetical protein
MAKSVLRTIGSCIYCGAKDDLRDEHIIPYFLYGDYVLVNASCKKCEAVTSKFEDSVGRKQFGMFRSYHKLRTKKPKKRIRDYEIELDTEKGVKAIRIPIDELGSIHTLPIFEPPGAILGKEGQEGITQTGIIATFNGGLTKEAFYKKYGYPKVNLKMKYNPSDFARMLAKIGYGMVVATYGLENVCECFVLPAIMGEKDDVGMWVGASEYELEGQGDMFYRLNRKQNLIEAVVKMFGRIPGAPTYRIIVGVLKDDTKAADFADKGIIIKTGA